ncbi:pentatricopeptide repeat-containing protein At1g69290 isoform X2 [Phalaenopsis equestris]|uniref:pentatricopeptide repeat-containing protein At1g69290 isoform X2 n=1 Tax=Phalaenopsis equestris TaxID=78828 RepID=UPI0009E5F7A4|nr:pentatricopeptide repeat-containing protein At1g69290 isoform X2 [Phalaenopsis equestris]
MWRNHRLRFYYPKLLFSSTTASGGGATSMPDSEIPVLYSFLQPSIFALRKNPKPSPPSQPTPRRTLMQVDASSLESALESSLLSNDTEEAWRSFKTLTSLSRFPSPVLSASLISHLSALNNRLSLKRAFATSILLLEKNPESLSFESLEILFSSLDAADASAPALSLVKSLLKNRFFAPFSIWGRRLLRLTRKNGGFEAFLNVFEDSCRVALVERIDFMKPDLVSCNLVLDGCCRELSCVASAERVLQTMSAIGLAPDSESFGSLAFLYASKGLDGRIHELEKLMDALGLDDRMEIFRNLISGNVKFGNLKLVSSVILSVLKETKCKDLTFIGDSTFAELTKEFLNNGGIKELASLIIQTQELESLKDSPVEAENSAGFGIINACISLGFLEKAHSIVDEMNSQGAVVGLGVYSSMLKAYCKLQRTAEAAQLVTEISSSGLQLDSASYDSLIDASMSVQDFQSAFSLFRDMREARLPELKTSYITIMTGLMENNRPELMASFLDSVVNDPRVEIATHDWNSIIHVFCKVGRLEDARRTYRRMLFLRFEPNFQTYLSLINGYVSSDKYFSVLLLWTEVIEKAQELKIFIDKWRHKQAFMETHKKLKVQKLRKRNFRKMEALIAFKNWAGLNA